MKPVRNDVSRLLDELQVTDRTQAALAARKALFGAAGFAAGRGLEGRRHAARAGSGDPARALRPFSGW